MAVVPTECERTTDRLGVPNRWLLLPNVKEKRNEPRVWHLVCGSYSHKLRSRVPPSGRTVTKILSHSQTGPFVNSLKLNFIHQGSDQFETPPTSFFRGIFTL